MDRALAVVTLDRGGVDVVEVVEVDGVLVERVSGRVLGVELVALLPVLSPAA